MNLYIFTWLWWTNFAYSRQFVVTVWLTETYLFYQLPKNTNFIKITFKNLLKNTAMQLLPVLSSINHISDSKFLTTPHRMSKRQRPKNDKNDINSFRVQKFWPLAAKYLAKNAFKTMGNRLQNEQITSRNRNCAKMFQIMKHFKQTQWRYLIGRQANFFTMRSLIKSSAKLF